MANIDIERQKKQQIEAAQIRAAIIEGYRDAIQGRTVPFKGDLRILLKKKRP